MNVGKIWAVYEYKYLLWALYDALRNGSFENEALEN